MPALNVNTDAVIELTRKLDRMRKSDLPVTVRKSLNNAAFDHRNATLPAQFKRDFTQRNRGTVRAFTRVALAQGFNINRMRSMSGFIDAGRDFTDNMINQELGGTIERSLVPNVKARSGKSSNRLVAAKNRLRAVGSLKRRPIKRGSGAAFKSAAHSVGVGGVVNYANTQFRINYIRGSKIGATPLYSDKQGRKVRLKPRHTVRNAGLNSARKIQNFYIREAQKRIARR